MNPEETIHMKIFQHSAIHISFMFIYNVIYNAYCRLGLAARVIHLIPDARMAVLLDSTVFHLLWSKNEKENAENGLSCIADNSHLN